MRSSLTADIPRHEIYRILTGFVAPRPIAMVSSTAPAGVFNIAPFSFFNVVSTDPPMLGVAIGKRFGKKTKDTLRNIRAAKSFVVNIVNESEVNAMNVTSLDWAPEVDEFAASGLTPVADGRVFAIPRIAEAPIAMECSLHRIVNLGRYSLVIGKVEAFHVDERYVDAGYHVDFERYHPIGRLAGDDYCRTSDRMHVPREADTPREANRKTGGLLRMKTPPARSGGSNA